MTIQGIESGAYDGAGFVQYMIDYESLSQGHVIINSGRVGQVTQTDQLGVQIELRSLAQVLKQNSVIELTSITCRAAFGDNRCKMPLIWHEGSVKAVGAEADRTFTIAVHPDSNATVDSHGSDSNGDVMFPDNYFAPGVLEWVTGPSAGKSCDIEDFSGDQVTLLIPVYVDVSIGDTFRIRKDCDKSKSMCISYGNLLNMRAETELPRADGNDLQSPSSSSGSEATSMSTDTTSD